MLHVGRAGVDCFERSAGRLVKALALHGFAELADVVAVERALADHHLEAVFVGWVVAPRDLNPAVEVEMVHGEIEKRSRSNADVDHVQPGFEQPPTQGRMESRRAQPAIASDCHSA